jgi:hypothetical protein
LHNKKSYFRTLKNPDWDSLIRLTKAVFYRTVTQTTSFVPNKTRRVVWDSTVIRLRRLNDSLKVEKSSDVHWFSRINFTLVDFIDKIVSKVNKIIEISEKQHLEQLKI